MTITKIYTMENKLFKFYNRWSRPFFILITLFLLFSCENADSKVSQKENSTNEQKNVEVSDNFSGLYTIRDSEISGALSFERHDTKDGVTSGDVVLLADFTNVGGKKL